MNWLLTDTSHHRLTRFVTWSDTVCVLKNYFLSVTSSSISVHGESCFLCERQPDALLLELTAVTPLFKGWPPAAWLQAALPCQLQPERPQLLGRRGRPPLPRQLCSVSCPGGPAGVVGGCKAGRGSTDRGQDTSWRKSKTIGFRDGRKKDFS